jgi:transposase
MDKNILLIHERVDDIPLLIGVMQQLGLATVIDRHVRQHGHHQGLTTGWLVVVWLAYILSEGDHRKFSVQEWVMQHQQTLERLLGQTLRETDFTDDRLTLVLKRLSDTATWQAIEADLWCATLGVYEIEMTGVRLDSTTSYGYHTPHEAGVMQQGHSKDHRPDLPQVKLMAAAAEPAGHVIACDVHGGQAADDPLYLPLIRRVRRLLAQTGLLYTGDSKMSALGTRAEIAAAGDYYLTVLSLRSEARHDIAGWISTAVEGSQTLDLVWRDGDLLAAGYELSRTLSASVNGQPVTWTERVLVVRSRAVAAEASRDLQQRLVKAEAALQHLTPPPGRGQRAYRDAAALQTAVAAVLARYDVAGLLQVTWRRDEAVVTRYVGRGGPGPQRPTRTEVHERYYITAVARDAAAIAAQQARFGWRIYVTNMPAARLTLGQAVCHYRGGWCLERGFHQVKDRPLGLSPLFVWRDDQILGLTHLLTVGWRLLTLIESQVRHGLAQAGATLSGLYEGQPQRVTDQPTARRLLKAFTRAQLTLTHITAGDDQLWHLTPLSPLLITILTYLGLSEMLYTDLALDSS